MCSDGRSSTTTTTTTSAAPGSSAPVLDTKKMDEDQVMESEVYSIPQETSDEIMKQVTEYRTSHPESVSLNDSEVYEQIRSEQIRKSDSKKNPAATHRMSEDDSEYSEEEMAQIRASESIHALSDSARLARERVIKSLTQDSGEISRIRNTMADLKPIVSRYVEEKEKKRIARDTAEHLKRFWQLRDALVKDPLITKKDALRILYNYARSYASDVDIYKVLYLPQLKDGKRKREIEAKIEGFENLMNYHETGGIDQSLLRILGLDSENANARVFGSENSSVLKKARLRAKRIDSHAGGDGQNDAQAMTEEERKTRLDKALTREQLDGVRAADDWLVSVGVNSTKRLPFITRILSLSARERLFLYYILERNKPESAGTPQVVLSQTGYIPDVSRISRNMYRIPFRLWEKFGSDGIVKHHWGKLEAALDMVGHPEITEGIADFADALERSQNIPDDADDPWDAVESIEDYEERKKAKDALKLQEARDAQLEKTLKAVKDLQAAIKERDNAWIFKQKATDKALLKAADAANELTELFKLDDRLAAHLKTLYVSSSYTDDGVTKDDAIFVSNQTLGIVSKISTIPKLFEDDIQALVTAGGGIISNVKYGDQSMLDVLTNVNVAGSVLSTAKGAIGLLSALEGTLKTIDLIKSGDLGVTDSILAGYNSANGLIGSASGVALGLTSMAYANQTAACLMSGQATEAVTQMKNGTGIAGYVVSGIALGANVLDYAVQGKHLYHKHQANKQIEELKKTGALQGDDAGYMDGITKLDTRNKVRQVTDTTFSTVSNIASTAVSAAAGPVGSLAWAGVSLGLTLVNKLVDYILTSHSHRKSAEEFLQMDNLDDILDEMDPQRKQQLMDSKHKDDLTNLKRSLVNHMAAELGFTTFKTFFKHIVNKYGAFLFNKLFYSGNDPIIDGTEDNYPTSQACVQLLKGMGLRIRFPKSNSDTDMKKRHPSLSMIIKKLGG